MNEASVWIRFVLAVFATWRVTHLLASEDGPADIVVRFRALLGHGLAGKLMDCFNCLSLWIAAPAALFVSREPLSWLFSWLGLSGAACLLERFAPDSLAGDHALNTSGRDAAYVLRTETLGAEERSDSNDNADNPSDRVPERCSSPHADTRFWTGAEVARHIADAE